MDARVEPGQTPSVRRCNALILPSPRVGCSSYPQFRAFDDSWDTHCLPIAPPGSIA